VDESQQMRLNSQVYKSIKVKVDFASGTSARTSQAEQDAGFGLAHLSGGQKTVVVVSMIFAVLQLDPAPFYILDEFDHALDAQYRSAIALIINEMAAHSQFLITTFKPELLHSANAKIFEVTFQAKRSAIIEIDREKALRIVSKSASPNGVESSRDEQAVKQELINELTE